MAAGSGPARGVVAEALAGVAYEMRTWLRMMRPGSPWVAPYYPTPDAVIERMLHLVGCSNADTVIDLGCGDGRVLVAAGRRGARGVGYELDPQLAGQARENVERAGLGDRVQVVQGDAFGADVRQGTVLALYLSEFGNRRLLQSVGATLRPGTKVVSFTFAVEGWDKHLLVADRADNLPVFLYSAPDLCSNATPPAGRPGGGPQL